MALRSFTQPMQLPMRVWDAPTRLFHWAIVLLIVFSYVSVQANWMELHLLSGYTVLTLLLFRIVWGFVGSETSRFARFLRSPLAGMRHLAEFTRRAPDTEVGHNAAGGWMVLLMLLLLAAQIGTGLFSNDDGATEGPLAKHVPKDLSDRLSGLHGILFWVLLGTIAVHVGVVVLYAVVKKQNLVRPMLTGKKRLPAATPAPRMASSLLALAILAASALVVWAVATRA